MANVIHRAQSTRRCVICGRGPVAARQRSHSMRQTHRTVFANLQQTPRGLLCTRCLRSSARR